MGTNNSASNAAAAANQQSQQQVQNAVNQINSAYDSPARQQQYAQFGKNLNNYYDTQVNNQEAINARNLKFANARSGLTGGSEAVDSNTQLQKDYTNALLQASQAAQSGVSNLQAADTQAKNQQISLAQQGGYTGAIPAQSSLAMQQNLANASNSNAANSLGNLFSGTAAIYQNEQQRAAQRQAQVNPWGSYYGQAQV